MTQKWLVVGICGVTCGGKTTLATKLNKTLPNSKVISQDDYFLDLDDPRQVPIPELNHYNFEVMTCMDMAQMYKDIMDVIKSAGTAKHESIPMNEEPQMFYKTIVELEKLAYDKVNETNTNVLIIEGFSIFNYKPIEAICDLKYYLTLEKHECEIRRSKRVYEPPDCPGYFEKYVWPEYLKLVAEVQKTVLNVKYFDEHVSDPSEEVLLDIVKAIDIRK